MTGQTNTRTPARRMRLGAAAVSFLLVGFLVMQTSSAVFSGTTSNTGNTVTADTVTLSDDDGGSALFTVDGVVPNDTITRCIEVTYDGSATGDDLTNVKLYSNADYTDSPGDFDTQLNLELKIAASGEDCSTATPTWTTLTADDATDATISLFSTNHSDYSSGEDSGWQPAATPETRAFQVYVQFDGSAGNDYQDAELGTTIPLSFTWEVQSGSGTAK